jgi:hypothetical protein
MNALKNATWWVGVGMLAVAAGFVAIAAGWEMDRRLFPWTVGTPIIVLAVVHSLFGLAGRISSEAEEIEAPGSESLFAARLRIFAWVAGLIVLITVIGHHAALPLFLFVFMLRQGEKAWLAAAVAFCMWLFAYGLLDKTIYILFPRPYISIWLNL